MQSCKFFETNRETKQDVDDNNFTFELYIVKEYSGKKYFRIKTKYNGEDWIFYKKVTVMSDNNIKFSFETKYPEKKTDNTSYSVYEWFENSMPYSCKKTNWYC